MPVPINNANAFHLDQKVVAASMLSLVGGPTDLAADFSNQFVNAINAQRTSTAVVRLAPTVTMANTPASRDGLLPRTGATAGTVEVTLQEDKYFKVGIDTLGVLPAQTAREVGIAGGQELIRVGNANLLSQIEAQGTAVPIGQTFGTSTTSDEVWGALVDLVTEFQEKGYTEDYVLHVRSVVWARLIRDMASLRGQGDPRKVAADLLNIPTVRNVNLPTALAAISHRGAVAQAKVLSDVDQTREDFDDIVEGRVKVGTKVLDEDAVLVLTDGE